MTYEEKVKILKAFRDKTGRIKNTLTKAAEGDSEGDSNKKIQAIAELYDLYSPVVEMYREDLNMAVNPTSVLTTPIVIMTLRQMAEGIAQHDPAAAGVADILTKLFAADVLSISRNAEAGV